MSSRSAREAAIAARLGIATNMDNVAPHVAGSLVGFGRAGHSPERAWAAAGGGDGSPAPFGATTADAPGGGGRVTLPQYKERCAEVLREFFTSGDYDEIRRCYKELGSPFFGWEFVRRLLMLAMERSEPQREAASRLLSVMYAAELSMEQVRERGRGRGSGGRRPDARGAARRRNVVDHLTLCSRRPAHLLRVDRQGL